jgi:1-acyl-sn-glycerol-3-phosphate acyltransferase
MVDGGAKDVAIQPVTIAYTRIQGLPVSRTERPDISGLNARGFKGVVRGILMSPRKEVTVAFLPTIPLSQTMDRKAVTRLAEGEVRRMLVALNRGLPLPPVAGEAPSQAVPVAA